VFSVSLGGGGGVVPRADVTGRTEAFVGAPGGTTGVNTTATQVSVSGPIVLKSFTDLKRNASADASR